MNINQEVKATLKLAAPMVAGQLAQFSLHIVDTMMCGRLGGLSLAGAGIGSSFLAMLWLPATGVVSAVSPLCAQAYGAQKPDLIKKSLHQALLLSLYLFIPLFLLLSYSRPLLQWLGQPAELLPLAEQYLQAAKWGLLPALGVAVLRNFMDSLGKPRAGMIVAISGVFINIIANWILMFGKFGLPALGVAGTGWATTLVNTWMFVCLWLWLYKDVSLRIYLPTMPFAKHDRAVMQEILKIGLPMGGSILTEVWLFIGTAFLMGHFGSIALAAHQIALNIASTTFMVALGISNASSVRVAQAMGKSHPQEAYRAGLMGMCLGLLFMGTMGLLLWFTPAFFIGLYLDLNKQGNLAVIDMASHLLKIAALFQIFDALQVTSQGALRGLKDTKIPMLLGFLCYGGVGLGSALIFAYPLQGKETGLWWGLTFGLMTAGLTLSWRFRSHFLNLPEHK